MYQIRYAIFAILCWMILADGDFVRNENICGPHNGRRLYLELGEKGILYAKNISFAKRQSRQQQQQQQQQQQEGQKEQQVPTSVVYASNSSHEQCSLELVTCPSCVITVTFRSLALSHHCGDAAITIDNPCRCDYVWISEPPYEDVSGTPFCGLYAPITYRSSTRTLSITLLYSESHKHAFTLEYTAERNRLHLKGTELMTGGAKGLNSTGGGILTSPFFPARYPRDLGLEYIVTCPTEAPSCRIRLLFSDFQLATVSIMEFYDWNGQRLDVSSGARFRPPVIVSSGPSLLIRFYANGGTGLGYKAFYSFVVGHLFDKSVQPITDCGGYVENLGGAITMMDMVGEGVKTYDCVWLIRPPKNFLHMKTHMYLKVITFADMAGNTELVIKQGPTSALLPLEVLRHPARQIQPPRHHEHIAPVTSGFHVSLRGTFGASSHLAIAYAAFSYMDCFAGSDFLCQNHRCIPTQLNCDGFDHCGDNSDEPATCFQDWDMEPRDRKWHVSKANYYFPKIDRYPDLKTATLVFVASSLGLIVLISALIILLYRMGARARQQRELQSRLQTISELLDGARIDEISVPDDPPVYEAPPGYDEVVKLTLENESVARKKRRSISREPRSRSSPNRCSSGHPAARPSSCPQAEGTASTSRGSQTTPVSSQIPINRRLPDSPPPPYVTPPATLSRITGAAGLSTLSRSASSTLEGGPGAEFSCSLINAPQNPLTNVGKGGNGENGGNCEEGHPRRDWLRGSGEHSRSLPESGSGSGSGSGNGDFSPEPGLSSLDAEVLGAYLRGRVTSNPTCKPETSYSDSQPKNSRDASTDIVQGDHEEKGECPDHQGEITEGTMGEITRVVERTTATVEGNGGQEVTKLDGEFPAREGCSCEGACGCANNFEIGIGDRPVVGANRSLDIVSVSEDVPEISMNGDRGETEVERKRRASRESDAREEESDPISSKGTIVRLLGSKAWKSQSASINSTSASTSPSTPSGTLVRKSSRKFSVCSRDSYMTKISLIGSCSSYEKLQDEFEIVSEAASVLCHTNPSTMTNTPSGTPKSLNGQRIRRAGRRYSSCDLESLYDGIRVLDNFLARRGLTVAHARKQSVAVMLFGTPHHAGIRRGNVSANYQDHLDDQNFDRFHQSVSGRNRVWRSSEDTLSN